ncbi:MAG TPA: outer membrane beta-barrel protein [Bacteroidia bacterium]|nr:outer membrane beta-barrel protein [Bacteroidia bacterium]
MTSDDKQFDDLVRGKMDSRSFEPGPDSWRKAQKLIRKERKRRRIIPVFVIFILASCLMVAGITALLLRHSSGDEKQTADTNGKNPAAFTNGNENSAHAHTNGTSVTGNNSRDTNGNTRNHAAGTGNTTSGGRDADQQGNGFANGNSRLSSPGSVKDNSHSGSPGGNGTSSATAHANAHTYTGHEQEQHGNAAAKSNTNAHAHRTSPPQKENTDGAPAASFTGNSSRPHDAANLNGSRDSSAYAYDNGLQHFASHGNTDTAMQRLNASQPHIDTAMNRARASQPNLDSAMNHVTASQPHADSAVNNLPPPSPPNSGSASFLFAEAGVSIMPATLLHTPRTSVGPVLGAGYDFHAGRKLSMQAGVRYTFTGKVSDGGVSYTSNVYSFGVQQVTSGLRITRLHYLCVPVSASWHFTGRSALTGGASLNYLFTTESRLSEGNSPGKTVFGYGKNLSSYDVLLSAGYGFYFSPHWSAHASVYYGLLALKNGNEYGIDLFDHNHGMTLTLQYGF